MLSTFISLQTSINYHIKKIKAKPLIIVENEDWLCLISCIFLRFNSYANIYIYITTTHIFSSLQTFLSLELRKI